MFDRSRRTRRAGYDIEGIGEGVYRINEYNVANCYLIIGSEKALLIDTGAGVNDLRSVIAPLAGGKPVEAALTTALPWHSGGRAQFDKIYLSEKENPYLESSTLRARKNYLHSLKFFFKLKVIGFRNCRWVRGAEPETVFVSEGDVIDLGGKTVRVYESKGLTRGALSYLAVENRLLFVGDTYNPCTYLGIKRAAKTEELKTTLQRILRGNTYDAIFATHFVAPVPRDKVQDAVDCIERIVRHTNGLPFPHVSSYRGYTVVNWGHKRRVRRHRPKKSESDDFAGE